MHLLHILFLFVLMNTFIIADDINSQPAQGSFVRRRPSGVVIINQLSAQFSVRTNLPKARWVLVKDNTPVYEGVGSVDNLQVVEGANYRIVPEELEGYTVRVIPSSTFTLYFGLRTDASIIYERTFGTLSIDTPFPNGQSVTITLQSKDVPPTKYTLPSKEGKIFWQSRQLPTGAYEISYDLPEKFNPTPPDKVIIGRAQRVKLTPRFEIQGGLHVTANIPDAIFILKAAQGSQIWRGEGRDFTFYNIPTGMYTLSFATQDAASFISPKEMKLYLNETELKEVPVIFQMAGTLTINTNIVRSHATIQELGGQRKTYREDILNRSKVFHLPEGRYHITLSTFAEDDKTTAKFSPPDPIDILVAPFSNEELHFSFELNKAPDEKQLRVLVNTGIVNGGFSLYQRLETGKETIGHFSGKTVQVTIPSTGNYELIFDDLPNYETPQSQIFDVQADEVKNIQATYTPLLSLVDIPEGRAIIGEATSEDLINELPSKIVTLSAFSIGIYEVTNVEYASWLNRAIKNKTIGYVSEADNRGQVVDTKGQLLFKTFEADPFSQISAQQQSGVSPAFIPLAGKESYPVINVSWYGAVAYCQDNDCRLPTEAEWEKAAGMEPETVGTPLRKFRFGFGKDEIDRTWANYKDSEVSIQHFRVLTTPVGFYNGVNLLPLDLNSRTQQKTNLAKSPYGAFDMSGNVWEWTADWFDEGYYANMSDTNPTGPESGTKKVAKGGCYDSLADGVRVSERMGLLPDYADAYTGFRIAKP